MLINMINDKANMKVVCRYDFFFHVYNLICLLGQQDLLFSTKDKVYLLILAL